MKFSIQPNEIAGFIYFFCSTTPEQQNAWLDKFPALKKTDFENLMTVMSENKKKSHIPISASRIYDFMDHINNLDDLKKILDGYPGKDVDINQIKRSLDSVWPIYHSFYQQHNDKLNSMADQASVFMNNEAKKSLEKVARFFNCEIPQEYTIPTYIYPVVTNEKDSHKRGGENRKTGEFIWLSDSILKKDNPEVPFSMIFHETTHNIFDQAQGRDKALSYLTENSPVSQFFENHPQMKRSSRASSKDSALWLLNEVLTTAFQGIFERDVLKQKREVLYANPMIDIMAHKMMPVLESALKTEKTFGPEIIKIFEKEFEVALPQIKKEMTQRQENSPMMIMRFRATQNG